ncbi:hypothetical protein BX070DRAFT_244828 [Coemansia spiralis]|nr:hypothetical protein BX070DRAFT_244828 [Coemansia spiralis]
MSSNVHSKQLLTEGTKFRVLCFMFRFFTLEENNIANLSNQTSASFQQLMSHLIFHQPNLRDAGNSLNATLESFVSNQNSRIFCALADLYEWHKTNMGFDILQLTLKHIHSIFRRPPYELRPYTRELTYAQRLVMIYHVCDNNTWSKFVDAYDLLHRTQFGKSWEDRDKFLPPIRNNTRMVPPDILRTIHECMSIRLTSPLTLAQEPSPSLSTIEVSSGLGPTIRDGKVIKRRAFSSTSKSKAAKAALMNAALKPRSISFANNTGIDAAVKPMLTDVSELQAQSLLFSASNPFANPANWLNTTAAPVVPVSRNNAHQTNSQALYNPALLCERSTSTPEFCNSQQTCYDSSQQLISNYQAPQVQQLQQQPQQQLQPQIQQQILPHLGLLGLNNDELARALSLASSITTSVSTPTYSEPLSQQAVSARSTQFTIIDNDSLVLPGSALPKEDISFHENLAFNTSLMNSFSQ